MVFYVALSSVFYKRVFYYFYLLICRSINILEITLSLP